MLGKRISELVIRFRMTGWLIGEPAKRFQLSRLMITPEPLRIASGTKQTNSPVLCPIKNLGVLHGLCAAKHCGENRLGSV